MRALKALVVIMGILLVAGTVTLVILIIKGGPRRAAVQAVVPGAGHARLILPAGGRIEGMAGVGDRLVLRIAGVDGKETLLVVDPATGAVVETISLEVP